MSNTAGGPKTRLSVSSFGAQREIAECVAMVSRRLENVVDVCSTKLFESASCTSTAAAGTAQLTSSGSRSRQGSK